MRLRAAATAVVAGIILLATGLGPAAATVDEAEILTALDANGRYLDLDANGLDAAADRANGNGIAFVWLDIEEDGLLATSLAEDYADGLDQLDSQYRTVVVLLGEGFGASSTAFDQADLDNALDASLDSFAAGAAANGLDTFTDNLVGSLTTATTTPSGSTSTDGGSGGGFGFGSWLLGFGAIGGGFMAIRAWINRRRSKKQAIVDMEEDRAEIKEQLKNNADRVISLGDRAIASGDNELIATYEEASATYQSVSHGVDGASTAEEVDALDDQIDQAEWQFEVIEARLDGRTPPPSPAEQEAAELPPPSAAPSAPAPSNAEPHIATSPRTGRSYPRTTTRRRRSGGGLGGALGSILGSVILGGGLGGNQSRRTQRRTGYSTGASPRMGGGLGGGVLNRGGGSSGRSRSRTRSRATSRSRSRSRSSRGRSFKGTRSRGGRSF